MAGRHPVLELALDRDTAVECPRRMAPLAWHSLLHKKLFRLTKPSYSPSFGKDAADFAANEDRNRLK
jgi:hypothetical protein